MDIGIGLPATIPGVEGSQLTEWAKKADEAGFSTLGTIDRIVYGNYEPFIAAFASNAKKYKKPVLYFNGDSHIYRSDNPLQEGSTCYTETASCGKDAWQQHPYYDVPNFHRIVVHGSTFPLEGLKLKIDPRSAWENASTPTSWGPFSWQREIQAQLTP